MSIRAIIIDDERLARNELKKLLQEHADIEIVEEARKMAIDYFDFNIIGAFFGKRTHGFATILDDEE